MPLIWKYVHAYIRLNFPYPNFMQKLIDLFSIIILVFLMVSQNVSEKSAFCDGKITVS
jgi:hypothetical protein